MVFIVFYWKSKKKALREMCARKYMFGDKSTYLVHAKMIKTKKIRIKTKKLPCNLLIIGYYHWFLGR